MNWLQWLPLIATLALIYLLRWLHIGVTNFKVFVLILLVWTLLLIIFYHRTRPGRNRDRKGGEALDAGLSSDDYALASVKALSDGGFLGFCSLISRQLKMPIHIISRKGGVGYSPQGAAANFSGDPATPPSRLEGLQTGREGQRLRESFISGLSGHV